MKSIKWTLLALLLPALVVLICGELWLSYRELRIAANAAYDRSLAGAIKGIDAGVSTESGGLAAELPYQMLEFFQLTAGGKVLYRISTEDGLVTLGNADLPEPAVALIPGVPHFYDAEHYGEPVRIGAYARRLDKPLYGTQAQTVIIQVAESTESRSTFVLSLLRQSVLLDVLLVLVMALLMTAAVIRALHPLLRARAEVLARARDDFAAMDATRVPSEIRPLVEAINHHIGKWVQLAHSQKQFLEDASHQLRTPIALLRTQVDYALREPDPARVRDALAAMQTAIVRSARLVNQLLALARVDSIAVGAGPTDSFCLATMVNDAARSLMPEARRKRQTLSFVAPEQGVWIEGTEWLLREAVLNVVDNAIKYAPDGGHVALVVHAEGDVLQVSVTDDGPGIPAAEWPHIGERFRRGKSAVAGGAGLGLAIAKTIMAQHGGDLQLASEATAPGLTVHLILPASAAAPRQPALRNSA